MLKENPKFESFKNQVIQHKWLLIVPVVSCTLLALLYAFGTSPKWSATQAIVIRDEMTGTSNKPGRFNSLDEMKTVQETVLETCKSPYVLRQVLQEAGHPSGKQKKNWPSLRDIEDLQKFITVAAPNGAEFGQTEILHVTVKHKSQERATMLASKLCQVVQQRFNELRSAKATSMEKEMHLAMMLNQEEVDKSTKRLSKMEEAAGVDLGELRSLTSPNGGSGTLQNNLANTRTELRTALQENESLQKQYDLLLEAHNDPSRIISTSNELLVAQPALKRLKEGLIDAQLNKATVMSLLTDVHPKAKAAAQNEKQVRDQIKSELTVALAGLQSQLEVSQSRVDGLAVYEQSLQDRLNKLSSIRADYENAMEDLARARRDLAVSKTSLIESKSAHEATVSSSQIVMVDKPLVSSRPEGLAKRYILMSGLLCGLAIAAGLFVYVTSPKVQNYPGRSFVDALLDKQTEETKPEAELDAIVGSRAQEIDQLIEQLKEYEDIIESKLSRI